MTTKVISKQDNFKVWKEWELMTKYASIITKFIEQGALNQTAMAEDMKDLYDEYLNKCIDFYNTLNYVYKTYIGDKGKEGISFSIDYTIRKYTMGIENQIFNAEAMAMANIDVEESFKVKLKKLVE